MQKFRLKSIASLSILTLLNSVLSFSAFANDSKEGLPALSDEYCITDISLIAHGDTHNVYRYTPDMVARTKKQTNFIVGTWNSSLVDVTAAGGQSHQGNADFSYRIAKISESIDFSKPESLCYEDILLFPHGNNSIASLNGWAQYGYWRTPWAFNPEFHLQDGKTGMTLFVKKIKSNSNQVLTKLSLSQGKKYRSGWNYDANCGTRTIEETSGTETKEACLGGWAQGSNEDYGFRLEKENLTGLNFAKIDVVNAQGSWKEVLDCAGSPCELKRIVTTGITKGEKITNSKRHKKIIKNAFTASVGASIMGVTASASYNYSDERQSQASNSTTNSFDVTKTTTSSVTCNSKNLYQWVLQGEINKCAWNDASCSSSSYDSDFELKTASYVCTPEKITAAESTNPLWAGCETKEVTNPTNIGKVTYADPSNKTSAQVKIIIPVTSICDMSRKGNTFSTIRFAMLDQQLSFWQIKDQKFKKWDFRSDIPDSTMSALAAIGDLNNDGENDMLWFNKDSLQFEYWLMEYGKRISGGIFTPKVTKNMDVIGIADINNDGHNNIILSDNEGRILYWNIRNLKFKNQQIMDYYPENWSPVGVGNTTQGGDVEIIFYDQHSALMRIWKLKNGKVDYSRLAINVDFTRSESEKWKPNSVTDINQDGISDIIFSNGSEFRFLIINPDRTTSIRKVNFNLPKNSNLIALVATK